MTPQWSRPLTGAESPSDDPHKCLEIGSAAMEPPPHGGGEDDGEVIVVSPVGAAMEPPPHGGGEATPAVSVWDTALWPQWSRPLTGAESDRVGVSSCPFGLPQWSRPLTGAESGAAIVISGSTMSAAMEPPPHGGGERVGTRSACRGDGWRRNGAAPSRGRRGVRRSTHGTRSGPRRNGAAPSRGRREDDWTLGPPIPDRPQWSRPLTGAERARPLARP